LPLEEGTDNLPHEQLLARLDISTLDTVAIENSSNDPPCAQWLVRLDVSAESSLSLFINQPRPQLSIDIEDPPHEQ
jgi:hypothetical protein